MSSSSSSSGSSYGATSGREHVPFIQETAGCTAPFSTSPIEIEPGSFLHAIRTSSQPAYNGLSLPAAYPTIPYLEVSQQMLNGVVAHRKDLQSSTSEALLEQFVTSYLEKIRKKEDLLREFFEAFPAGNLHVHLDGGIWPESWIKLAIKYGLFFSTTNGEFVFSDTQGEGFLPAAELETNSALAEKFISFCSMTGAEELKGVAGRSAHFFKCFDCIESIAMYVPIKDRLVAYLKNALLSKMIYVELMVDIMGSRNLATLPDIFLSQFDTLFKEEKLSELFDILDPWAREYCEKIQNEFNEAEMVDSPYLVEKGFKARRHLTSYNNPTVARYIVDFSRFFEPPQFFAATFASIKLCRFDSRFVGFTISGPEHNVNAFRLFPTQMKIISAVSRYFNFNNINLHAGELVPSLAQPIDFSTRIQASIEAGSKRIGHGYCLSRSKDWSSTLIPLMIKNNICIEALLHSNTNIIGSGDDHPINAYIQRGVAVTLGTDDEGLTRTGGLAAEYELAAQQNPGIKYPAFKKISRNSISYSFLPGESIFKDHYEYELKEEFEDLRRVEYEPSESHRAFFQQNPLALLQARLEIKLVHFESVMVPKFYGMHNSTLMSGKTI